MHRLLLMHTISSRLEQWDQVKKIWGLVSFFAIPAYLFFFSSGNFNWIIGMNQLFNLESLYAPEFAGGSNPYGTKIYPYMPIFAIINAIITFPGYVLITTFLQQPAPTTGSISNILFVAIGLIATGFWSYLALISIPYFSKELFVEEKMKRITLLVFLFFPPLWLEVFSSGANSLVALLALVGIYFVKKKRWMLAGVAIGLSMFKFNALPLGIVLFIYAIWGGKIRSGFQVLIGGILSQIPNIFYFLIFPEDLLMIIERRGALTAHAHTLSNRVFLEPIANAGLGEIYITIFPVIVVLFGLLGGVLAVKSAGGLPAGMAVGFFSTSFLVPGEQRILTFIILLLLILIQLVTYDIGKFLLAWVLAVTSYSEFAPFTRDSYVLGLTSSEHSGALGIENGVYLIMSFEYVSIVIIFVAAIYLLEKKAENEISSLGFSN